MREGDGERKVRVVGLGGLLSASPGRQPSVHTNLALRRRHTATTRALMSCDMHYATGFGRSSGKYLFPSLYDHGFRSFRPEVNSGIGGTTPQIGVRHDFFKYI